MSNELIKNGSESKPLQETKPTKTTTNNNNNKSKDSETVTIPKAEFDALNSKINSLTQSLKQT